MGITKDQSRSRRGLLAGALGGLAAVVGGKRVAAAEDTTDANAVHKGVNNPTGAPTSITCNGATSIRAISTGSGTDKSGVFASASGTNSRGVTGVGVTGVAAQSNAAAGRGVFALANGANAIGVFGAAESASGAPVGALGRSKSPNGFGVIGRNLATTGAALGVLGDSKSPNGFGVVGSNLSPVAGALAAGVKGVVNSPSAAAVRGENNSEVGNSRGVIGRVRSPEGEGVTGINDADTGRAFGVRGDSTGSPSGVGVVGVGSGIGVSGESFGDGAVGVSGDATSGTGGTGVRGTAAGASGRGGSFAGEDGAVALHVDGPVQFSSSGIATVTAGTASVTVSPGVPVSATTKVLCTLMSNPGGTTTVQRVAKGATSFNIILTASSAADCDVAWFVIS